MSTQSSQSTQRTVSVSDISARTIKKLCRAVLRYMDYEVQEVNRVDLLPESDLQQSFCRGYNGWFASTGVDLELSGPNEGRTTAHLAFATDQTVAEMITSGLLKLDPMEFLSRDGDRIARALQAQSTEPTQLFHDLTVIIATDRDLQGLRDKQTPARGASTSAYPSGLRSSPDVTDEDWEIRLLKGMEQEFSGANGSGERES